MNDSNIDATFTLQEWTEGDSGKVLFNGTECTIGRGEDCDLVFPDDTYMSKKHARISVIPDSTPPRFLIEDLGATNGVFVNEMKFPNYELKQGAVIQCGKQKFHFSYKEPIASEPGLQETITWNKAPMCEALIGQSIRTSIGEGRLSWAESLMKADTYGPVSINLVLWKGDRLPPEIRGSLPAFEVIEIANKKVW